MATRKGCWERSLAHLLGCKKKDVPRFNGKKWYKKYRKWLRKKHGMELICITVPWNVKPKHLWKFLKMRNPGVRFIVNGTSDTGSYHSETSPGEVIAARDQIYEVWLIRPITKRK